MTRRLICLLLAIVLLAGPAAASAWACPFCGEANATDQARSDAYQLSILFMLAVPALVFGGFAYGFYRLSRRIPTTGAAEGLPAAPASDDVSAIAQSRLV